MRRNATLNWTAIGFGLFIVVASLALEGCPALLIPGLAYQGYKYEKSRDAKSTTSSTTSGERKNPSANQPSNDNSIE